VGRRVQILIEHLPVKLRARRPFLPRSRRTPDHFGFCIGIPSWLLVFVAVPLRPGVRLSRFRLGGCYAADYYRHSVAVDSRP